MGKCIIDLKLPSLNEYINICRTNKYGAAKFKKSIEEQIAIYLARLPDYKNPIKIHFHWVEENKRRDFDNVAFFGLDSQLKQLIEEMAELTQAICKYFRFNSDRYLPITEDEMERNLFEELADVTLMLYQVVYLLGCDEVVGEIANKKIKRTLERI